jgi:two-component system alkaline phosphatase synthesis response regulator PhoP
MKIEICLVEDDPILSDFIKLNLELEGYNVHVYNSGVVALANIKSWIQGALVILDNMLPSMSGIDVCKEIRKGSAIPILFLSAKGNTQDRIEGLKVGANDYLSKPFDLEELLLRVKVLAPAQTNQLQIGEVRVDLEAMVASDSNDNVVHEFSKKEMELLKLFLEYDGRVLSRDEMLDRIWGEDVYPTSRTIDNFILTFRKIFEQDQKKPVYFQSVRGVGYKFQTSQ